MALRISRRNPCGGMMAKNIDALAKQLGATVAGTMPDYSAGSCGMAALASSLRQRLEPGVGKRPGCPTNPAWSKRPTVPMAPETEQRLKDLASFLSDGERQVSPMQVAAMILESATASYFQSGAPARNKRPVG
jgi:hypothetical protein